MRTFTITEILGASLSSRPLARDLKMYVDNSGETDVAFDFNNVRFASRSFMDEFYNLFLKETSCVVTNMSEDIVDLLEAVKATQHGRKPLPEETAEFHTATDFEDMNHWFEKMAI